MFFFLLAVISILVLLGFDYNVSPALPGVYDNYSSLFAFKGRLSRLKLVYGESI